MVYIDLLVIENLIINYVILYGVGIVLNRVTRFPKILFASAIGNIPLIFLFCHMNNYFLNVITFIFAIIMSLVSFNYKDIVYTIKNVIYMYLISVFLAGGMYLVNTNLFPTIDSYLVNTVVLVMLSPIITHVYIKSTFKVKLNSSNYYLVDIYFKDKSKITVNAFLDTGNKLVDPYSKKAIILVSKDKICKLDNPLLVPYNTITNHGLLECYPILKIYIHKIGYRKRVLIGLINEVGIEGADCILNSRLLERI